MTNQKVVLVLTDGKPGHFSAIKGIVHHLSEATPVQTVKIETRLRVKFMRVPLRWWLNRLFFIRHPRKSDRLWLQRLFYTNLPPVCPSCDLVISAGGDISFLNAWIAKALQVPNVFSGSLRNLNPDLFSLLVNLRGYGGPARNTVFVDIAPNAANAPGLLKAGVAFAERAGLQGRHPVWAVLVGDSANTYDYTPEEFSALAEGLCSLAKRDGAVLLITTSRRTRPETEDTLARVFAQHPECVAYQVYFNRKPEKCVAGFLGAADAVFVTEESGTMMSESVQARKPVYTLLPKSLDYKPPHLFALELEKARLIRRVPIKDLTNLSPAGNESAFTFLPLDAFDELGRRLAALLRRD